MDIWPKIQFITIDNISMVGCILLTMMHIKLHRLKCNILPFGRINIMFMGIFLQFPLINDTPLYSTHIQLIFLVTKSTKKKCHRKSLGKLHSAQTMSYSWNK